MKIISLCLFLIFSSCSILTNREIDYSESYVTGVGAEKLSSEEIQKNLYRDISMAGGNYQIKAFPITAAYINSLSKELSGVKNLSKNGAKSLRDNLYDRYLNNKVCIDTKISVKEFQQVKEVTNWNLVFIDSNNIAYQLEWLPEPPSNSKLPDSVTTIRSSYHGKEKMWNLAGVACTVSSADLKKGFKVVFKPSFVQWPFNDESEEEWTFNYKDVVDGKEVLIKKKERKKQSYRGW